MSAPLRVLPARRERARPLALRRLSALAACRARFGVERQWTGELGREWAGCELRLTPATCANKVSIRAVRLQSPAGVWLLPDVGLLELAGGVVFDPAWPPAVVTDVARVAVGRFDPGLVIALGSALAVSDSEAGIGDGSDAVDALLTLVAADSGERFSLHVRPALDWLRWCLRSNDWKPVAEARPPSFIERIPFRGSLLLDGPALSARALRALRAGDAALATASSSTDPWGGRLALPGLDLAFAASSTGGLLCGLPSRERSHA